MAYDPNAAYEAPRRPYYGQAQNRAPAQAMGRSPPPEQYNNSYGNGHDQSYEQHYDTGYQQRQHGTWDRPTGPQQQESTYGNGYDRGYQRPQVPQYFNGDQQQQRQPERSHDPRYHQRPQKPPAQRAYGQANPSNLQQPPPQSARQDPQMQPQNHYRPVDPRHNVQQEAPRERKEGYEQQTRDPMMSNKSFGNGYAQDSMVQQKPKKLTMEEWKANERARMHAERSPETVAQDNAFPKFHNVKNGQKHDSHVTGNGSAIGYRSSEEQARPSTSNSRPGDGGQQDQKSVVPLDNRVERGPYRQHDSLSTRRSSTDQAYSLDAMRNNLPLSQVSRAQTFGTRPSQGPAWPQGDSVSREEYRQVQNPVHDQQVFPTKQSIQHAAHGQRENYRPGYQDVRPNSNQRGRTDQSDQRSQPSMDAPQTRLDSRSPNNGQNRQYGDMNPRQQSSDARHRKQAPRTDPAYPHSATPFTPPDRTDADDPAFTDYQPPAPVYLPERSGSAHGSRRPSAAQASGALTQYHQDVAVYQAAALQVPETNNKHVSLTDLYDDYHHDRDSTMAFRPPAPAVHTREDEIEAEMPNFDSAAPAQTSMLHKRNQTVDRHLASGAASASPPPMPVNSSRSINSSVQNLPTQNHQTHDSPYQHPRQPHQDTANGGQVEHAAFDFGLQTPPQEPQYAQRRQPPSNQQHGPAFDRFGAPQPPFARQNIPRRSMDDAGRMPSQQAPYSLPPYGNNPMDGPYNAQANGRLPQPSQQRPDIDRHASAQTTWSDPGLQRVPSAPIPQGGLPRPPRSANGVAPEYQQQNQQNNPDALPRHPPPVRPGLLEQAPPQPAKPPPIRNYNTGSTTSSTPSTSSHQKVPSVDHFARPVTRAELEQLQAAVTANPNSPKQSLIYVKKLVEAASVLASDGGRADAKTANRNRERYLTEAYKRLKKLATASYPDAQFYLADCHGSGMLGLEVDPKEAFNLYQAAAKQGHGQAAYRTAVCCEIGPEEGGGTRKDLAKAVQWYRRAAALGDVAAMYKLGMILLKGLLGQQENIGEAVSWLKRSAERADRENPHALHELGTLYEPANTKPQVRNKIIADENYARELFQQAAGLGYKFSQFRLGQAYEYGHLGLPLDHRSSIQWYSKAAAQGEHQAELALSGWYLTGAEGILEQNDTEAYLWARKAASSEPPLAKAMFAMGYFSEQGIGCPASLDDARRWYGRAASYKFPKALERLEELKKNGKQKAAPVNGKLSRKDQKKDEADCVVM
nr:chitin synthase regulatory factor 3 [Quercus suber]